MSFEKMVDTYQENFEVVTTPRGEEVYEWCNTQFDVFSTKKLADILTLSEMFDDLFQESFLNAVEEELIKRMDLINTTDCMVH